MTDPHSDPPSSTDDEPESPAWLPAVGFALFIIGGIAWVVTPPVASATPPPLPAPSVAPAPPPPPPAQAPEAPPPPPAQPTASAPANLPPALQHLGGAKGTFPGAPGGLLPRPTKKHP